MLHTTITGSLPKPSWLDCGMVPRQRTAARDKMRALVQGAALVRAELG